MFKLETRKIIIFAVSKDVAEDCAIENALDMFIYFDDIENFTNMCANTSIQKDTHVIWLHNSTNYRSDMLQIRTIIDAYDIDYEFKEDRPYFANLILDTTRRVQ